MKQFIISDLHFYHKNIINLCNRPYLTLEDMHSALINNWNSIVSSDDTVYILGDLSLGNAKETEAILQQLNGNKILIKGNHDSYLRDKNFNLRLFDAIYDYYELRYNGMFIVMSHYPLQDWNKQYRKSVHLYGHTHKAIQNSVQQLNRFCVCADACNYKPIDINTYKSQIQEIKFDF